MEFDFAQILHIDLDREFRQRSFRWFRIHVSGLLAHPKAFVHNYFREVDDG